MRSSRRRTTAGLALVLSVAALATAGLDRASQAQPGSLTTSTCTTARVLAHWSVRRLAEQTVIVPVDENHVAAISAEIADGAGGVILFGSSAPPDLAARLAALAARAPGGIGPLVMTDEEGGTVQRMANLVGSMPSARRMARTMTAAQITALAHRTGGRMAAAGVGMDLAPVLDLDDRPGPSATNADGTRSFSVHRAVTTSDGLAFAHGLELGGVVPVVKHFPGLGGASGNTDVTAATTKPWSRLRRDGLRPFAAAIRAGIPAVMVTNAVVPGLTVRPASLSPAAVHRLLRTRLGFSGLVLPDSLSAAAVRAAGFDVPRAAVQALRVGEDMALFNAAPDDVAGTTRRVVQAVVDAVGSGQLSRSRLTTAVRHVLHVKRLDLCSLQQVGSGATR
ncbi:glycoside hydrolase family 3 N-terminal domain-containing protein [Nocardioides cynanchi]|uniref:glycoside hydrolase family 3 N-terminal domain-containing protein n=1 Tax=Nocardioides cynanchi TaxID=2558918 RepID=UPI0012464A3E|nr:glycoside hydrolase family 3 N-terminal domain-containing protein [Nocardioides cynanchi]